MAGRADPFSNSVSASLTANADGWRGYGEDRGLSRPVPKHECPDASLLAIFDYTRITGWTLNEVLATPFELVTNYVYYLSGINKGEAELREAKMKR